MNRLLSTNKKGNAFKGIIGLALALITVGIVISIGMLVMANVQDEIVTLDSITESNTSTYTVAYNATADTISGVAQLPDWIGIFVIVGIGVVILGLVALLKFKGM